jgi:hypothetical protein
MRRWTRKQWFKKAASLLFLAMLLINLVSCMSATPLPQVTTQEVVKTVEVQMPGEEVVVTQAVTVELPTPAGAGSTSVPAPTATLAPIPTQVPVETSAPVVEARRVEVEWPSRMRLGDSDTIRLSLVPSSGGYKIEAEFPEHTLQVQDLNVARPEGYELFAVAALNGVGIDISPAGDQPSYLPVDQGISWHWSVRPNEPGQQRLTISLKLRWEPQPTGAGTVREASVYSKSLDVTVSSFFGLTRAQAMGGGLAGLFVGMTLTVASLSGVLIRQRSNIQDETPNPRLAIDLPAGAPLSQEERGLLSTLFRSYARICLEREFHSGYSGARTFLVLPVRNDGRADAPTIAKIGSRSSIDAEYSSYELYVKDRLPPVTARIQHRPVAVKSRAPSAYAKAAIRYTFIATPGQTPVSLGSALLQDPDPRLLERLFETFGPNWWMQRSPYTFRMREEYDRMLPAHLVIEPGSEPGSLLDGRWPSGASLPQSGDAVTLRNFRAVERRADGRSLSLRGDAPAGQMPVRIRWMDLHFTPGAKGRVTASRESLLRTWTAGFDLLGLPNPIDRLPEYLNITLTASRSVIHGDLNLENILVGPGGFVWLIDFARTREGHSLFDFAHLEAELIAHVIAPQVPTARDFLDLYAGEPAPEHRRLRALLDVLQSIMDRCLTNPSDLREAHLARTLACLGALKFANLDDRARHNLYLAAAHYSSLYDPGHTSS